MRRLLILIVLALALPATARAQAATRYFPETGFIVGGPVLTAFTRFGGVPVVGLPISDAMETMCEQTPCTVQWFERTRVEVHADGQAYRGRIGADFLAARGTPWQPGSGGGDGGTCAVFAETGHAVCGAFLDGWRRYGGVERLGLPLSAPQEERYRDGGTGADVAFPTQWFERAALEDHGAQGMQLRLLGSQTYPTWAEQLLVSLVNAERARAGLRTLAWDDQIAAVARAHSQDLARNNIRSHVGSDGRGTAERLATIKRSGAGRGEVIAFDQSPVAAFRALLLSPEHRTILMLPELTHLGAGYGYVLGQVRGGQWPATVWTIDVWVG